MHLQDKRTGSQCNVHYNGMFIRGCSIKQHYNENIKIGRHTVRCSDMLQEVLTTIKAIVVIKCTPVRKIG